VVIDVSRSRKDDARHLIDSMANGETGDLADLLAEDVAWWVPPSAAAQGLPRPLIGRAQVIPLIAEPTMFFRPGTRRWTVHHLVEEGDLVAVHANLQGQTAGGGPYTNEYHFLVRFEDGAIAEVWEHVDTAAFAEQMADSADDARG
jgi:ketosteroid isomerase-like protein